MPPHLINAKKSFRMAGFISYHVLCGSNQRKSVSLPRGLWLRSIHQQQPTFERASRMYGPILHVGNRARPMDNVRCVDFVWSRSLLYCTRTLGISSAFQEDTSSSFTGSIAHERLLWHATEIDLCLFLPFLSLVLHCNPHFCHCSGELLFEDPQLFASKVLPRYFKHSNVSSFERQLYYYSWKKIGKGSKSAVSCG